VAGPENADTDFTWAEFVRRTNDELVAGWGNLVNRTASMIHKNLGAIPEAGVLTTADRELLGRTGEAFGPVGELLSSHRQKQAVTEAMRVVGEANKYLSDQAPWKLRTSDPERMRTVLHVAAQAVSDCRTLLSPFLPHSAQAVHEAFGGSGTVSPMPEIREVDDLDGGPGYPVLMGDYRREPGGTVASWESTPIVAGTPVPAPSPVFRKLDDSVVAEELARLAEEGHS
jgi:methionyl-tRNA synthetase